MENQIGFCVCSMFCCTLLCVFSSFAITSMVIALLSLSFWCLVIVIVLWPFPTVNWAGLQCVILIFPDHTHLPLIIVELAIGIAGPFHF